MYTKILVLAFLPMETILGPEFQRLSFTVPTSTPELTKAINIVMLHLPEVVTLGMKYCNLQHFI